mmetsp:Transcript_11779/g.11713  ORF Transcript_11779/g.11713 Transcript_11779/m.11713 type:complete len:99 (-) Transcript_11779:1769-2065(-)
MDHCLLCYENMRYFAMGKCGHKNVCNTCSLRLRLIIKDRTCPICKTDMEEIFICQDRTLTFDLFLANFKGSVMIDRDDDGVYYENVHIKSNCQKLRSL